ncbi:MAG: hypothetical protein ABJH63_12540 [Rhizobiaceae bacterium]
MATQETDQKETWSQSISKKAYEMAREGHPAILRHVLTETQLLRPIDQIESFVDDDLGQTAKNITKAIFAGEIAPGNGKLLLESLQLASQIVRENGDGGNAIQCRSILEIETREHDRESFADE